MKELNDFCYEVFHEDFCKIEKNNDSTDGNVYIVYCKNNKYIAKIYTDKEHTKSMVDLHKKLSNSKINVPNIVCTNYNDCKNSKYIVIYSFVKGKQISEILHDGKIAKNTVMQVAKTIRAMHDVTCETNKFNLPEVPFDTYNKRKTMLHFDLTKSNIFKDDNIVSIIDFDDAKYGSAIYDVSILISFFFFSKTHGVDVNGIRIFIDEYYGSDIETKEEEVPLIKSCAIQWIDYLLSEKKLDASLIETFKTKRKLIDENL